MFPEVFERIGVLLFGEQWKAPMAKLLDVNEKTVRRYMEPPLPSGLQEHTIPDSVRLILHEELKSRIDRINDLLWVTANEDGSLDMSKKPVTKNSPLR